jgi:ATP-dependent exoDNAse (exonuclease V) alpha subunit
MTTVEILYRYAAAPTEQVATALARARDVYGIRQLSFDRAARTLRIEFDATRLNAAAVTKLLRETGLEIEPGFEDNLPQRPAPTPAATAPTA